MGRIRCPGGGRRGPHWMTHYNGYHAPGIYGGTLFPETIEPTANAKPIPTSGSKVFRVFSTTGTGYTGFTEPNWSVAVLVGDHVVDNEVTWELVGFTPTYARSQFIDDPVSALTPQTRKHWRDTSATDGYTVAPKAKIDSYRVSLQTTTNSANQVLFTTDALADNSTSIVNVTITGKQNGNNAESVSCKLSGTFYRNNAGAPTNVPTDDNVKKGTASLTNSTFDLYVNGNTIQVRTTPGVNAAVDWGVFVKVFEGKS